MTITNNEKQAPMKILTELKTKICCSLESLELVQPRPLPKGNSEILENFNMIFSKDEDNDALDSLYGSQNSDHLIVLNLKNTAMDDKKKIADC